eukprot:6232363-Amphidinium_carterae.1
MREDWDDKLTRQLYELTEGSSSWSKLGADPNTWLSRIVAGNVVGLLSAFVIFLNALCIGLEVEDSMERVLHNPTQTKPRIYAILNIAFTVFFLLELLVRVYAQRWSFLFGDDKSWNVFDAMLVAVSMLDLSSGVDGGRSTGYVRLLKTVRMVRVLRVIRVLRLFRELRRMVTSILSSMAALCWALFLLLIIMYVFSVIFMQAGVVYLDGRVVEQEEDPEKFSTTRDTFKRFYSSVGESLFSLTKAITGGEDWAPMAKPLGEESGLYVAAFVFYVFFVIFGVLNVLAGVFLTGAAEALDVDRDWLTEAETIKQE